MTSSGSLPVPAVLVRHAGGEYPVYIGRGLLAALPALIREVADARRAVVISDEQVAAAVPCPLDADRLTFPSGERSKSRETWARLTDQLLALGCGRDSVIVAVGGGVTGDLAGFVAATFLRGVPVIQIPTSLLAMLDASIGGKTGVDVPAGKNLVGAFHAPLAVVVDPDVLSTLPAEEYRAGLAEAVKHAVVADAGHLFWLEREASALLAREPACVEAMVRTSVAIKAGIVAADEHETGRRAVLNAGHTIAHALEAATEYGLRHGEAVAIGLVVEAALGERIGVTEPGTASRIAAVLGRLGLGTALPAEVTTEVLLAPMQSDKKARRGAVRFSLVAKVGQPFVDQDGWTRAVDATQLRTLLEQCR